MFSQFQIWLFIYLFKLEVLSLQDFTPICDRFYPYYDFSCSYYGTDVWRTKCRIFCVIYDSFYYDNYFHMVASRYYFM